MPSLSSFEGVGEVLMHDVCREPDVPGDIHHGIRRNGVNIRRSGDRSCDQVLHDPTTATCCRARENRHYPTRSGVPRSAILAKKGVDVHMAVFQVAFSSMMTP